MRVRAHLRSLMTQKSCAVGMRNAKLGNHLKRTRFQNLKEKGNHDFFYLTLMITMQLQASFDILGKLYLFLIILFNIIASNRTVKNSRDAYIKRLNGIYESNLKKVNDKKK